MPLLKTSENFEKIFTPKLSLKLSPNNNTKDVKDLEDRLDVNTIYLIDRLYTSNTVEGGISLTYGSDFSIK